MARAIPPELWTQIIENEQWITSAHQRGQPLSMPKADWHDLEIVGRVLTGAQLPGANLDGANLRDSSLPNVNLRAASLVRAVLDEAMLSEADLTEAKLAGASLRGSLAVNINLTRADLEGALQLHLRGARGR